MSRPDVSQAKNVSSSQESEPPNRLKELTRLIGLDNLLNFRLEVRGKDKDIYEDVLKALREGRDYEDWAWWPYLVFPIPHQLDPTDERDPHREGEFKKVSRKSRLFMMELLSNAEWGKRLGYAVKLLDMLGDSAITKIIEGAPGIRYQKVRRYHIRRFLLSLHSVLAVPGVEDDEEAKELCLQVVKGSWVGDTSKFEKIGDVWGYEEDPITVELKPADFETPAEYQSRGHFSQGVKRAAAGLPLNPKSPEVKYVISEDCLRERLGGKGNQLPSTRDEGMRVSGRHDVPGTRQGVRANSYPRQHEDQPTSTRDHLYRYVPSSSTSTRRQPAPAPDDYDYYNYKYEEDYISERDRASSSRQNYSHPTSTREYRGEPSSSRPRRAQPAPAPGEQVLPEHLRRISEKYRDDHGYPKGEYYISKQPR